jgi:hypothetical protein
MRIRRNYAKICHLLELRSRSRPVPGRFSNNSSLRTWSIWKKSSAGRSPLMIVDEYFSRAQALARFDAGAGMIKL